MRKSNTGRTVPRRRPSLLLPFLLHHLVGVTNAAPNVGIAVADATPPSRRMAGGGGDGGSGGALSAAEAAAAAVNGGAKKTGAAPGVVAETPRVVPLPISGKGPGKPADARKARKANEAKQVAKRIGQWPPGLPAAHGARGAFAVVPEEEGGTTEDANVGGGPDSVAGGRAPDISAQERTATKKEAGGGGGVEKGEGVRKRKAEEAKMVAKRISQWSPGLPAARGAQGSPIGIAGRTGGDQTARAQAGDQMGPYLRPMPGRQPEDVAKFREAFALQKKEMRKKVGGRVNKLNPFGAKPLRNAKKAGTDILVKKFEEMSEEQKGEVRDKMEKKKAERMEKRREFKKKMDEMKAEKEQKTKERDEKRWIPRKPKPVPITPVKTVDGKTPKGVGKKVLSKVPVVKRAYAKKPEEILYADVGLSFVAGLRMGIFHSDHLDKRLYQRRREALTDWLDLMSVSLPPEMGIHELIDALSEKMEYIVQSQKNLHEIIDKHPLSDKDWSPSCSKGKAGEGFACGFWKLLHLSTVGIAEQRGGLDDVEARRVFTTMEAADAIQDYIDLFYRGCETCRKNFLTKYERCDFGRCERLRDEAPELLSEEDWRELPLWMWELHNDLSVRVAAVNSTKRDAALMQWPNMENCFLCFKEDGEWDMEEVYDALEKTYWSGPDLDALKKMKKQKSMGRMVPRFCVIVGLVLLVAHVFKRRQLLITGMHKKFDSISSQEGKKA